MNKKYIKFLVLTVALVVFTSPVFAVEPPLELPGADGMEDAVEALLRLAVKIAILITAAMAPILLGDKIAAAIKGGVTAARKTAGKMVSSVTKKPLQNAAGKAFSSSKLGQRLGALSDNRELRNKRAALKDIAENHSDPLRRSEAKSELMKTYEGAMGSADKDVLIDRLAPYGHTVPDGHGGIMMKDLIEDVKDKDGNVIGQEVVGQVPLMKFDPQTHPELATQWHGDYEAQAALIELNDRNLSNDNVTAREEYIDDLNSYAIGRSDSDGLTSAGGVGFHQYNGVIAQKMNFKQATGMSGSKSGKLNAEKWAGMESGWYKKEDRDMTYHAQEQAKFEAWAKANPERDISENPHVYRGVDDETKQRVYQEPKGSFKSMESQLRSAIGSDHGRAVMFDSSNSDHVARNVGYLRKIMPDDTGATKYPNVWNSFTKDQKQAIAADVKAYNAGLPIPSVQRTKGNTGGSSGGPAGGGGAPPGGGGPDNVVPGPGYDGHLDDAA